MHHRPTLTAAFALAVGVCLAGPAIGQSLRIDEETGRSLANYLPHRDFDHTHMVLELDFPDFAGEARAEGVCAITMRPIGFARERVRLDAQGMAITGVEVDGTPAGYEHDGEELVVVLPGVVGLGESITVTVRYTLGPDQLKPDGQALSWSPPTRRQRGPSEQVPMLHSQGQPDYAARWFPCFNHPNERLATELIVTVHEGFEVVSNGELLGRETLGDGRVRWHWDQALPHAPYLVSLVIGRFDVVELGGPGSVRPGMPMPVYGPVGSAEQVRRNFANTPAMVAHFEELFDEPYPWAKYSQAIVRDFAAGAMENTSATTFFPFASQAEEGMLDGIIAHELVHQWFGDLVTCRNWSDLWLQEGWATFGEALWDEQKARAEALENGLSVERADREARQAYLRSIRGNFRQAARGASRTSAPEDPALASNLYGGPEQVFMKANNPYSRGACVLHMLRERLGDAVFWRGMRLYLDRNRFGAVETSDLRKVLEEVSGESLGRFFDQWVYRAGAPRVDVELDWIARSGRFDGPGTLAITVRQVQEINADNPAYAMVVPLYLRFEGGGGDYVYVETDRREVVVEQDLALPPEDVVIDPYFWNILNGQVTRDLERPEEEAPEAVEEIEIGV